MHEDAALSVRIKVLLRGKDKTALIVLAKEKKLKFQVDKITKKRLARMIVEHELAETSKYWRKVRRPSGDLIEEYVKQLFIVREQIRRLHKREEKLVRKIGRKREYEGLIKAYKWRGFKNLVLRIERVEPKAIAPALLLKVLSRRPDFSMQEDFLNMVVVSVRNVRSRFGLPFTSRLGVVKNRYTRIIIDEVLTIPKKLKRKRKGGVG